MKTKSFQAYLEKRFTKEELAEIDREVQKEVEELRASSNEIRKFRDPKLQAIVEKILEDYAEALQKLADT